MVYCRSLVDDEMEIFAKLTIDFLATCQKRNNFLKKSNKKFKVQSIVIDILRIISLNIKRFESHWSVNCEVLGYFREGLVSAMVTTEKNLNKILRKLSKHYAM